MQPLEYSVVAPMHNEEGNIQALYLDIKRAMEQLKQPYEVVFVNNASLDTTLQKMKEIQSGDPNFSLIWSIMSVRTGRYLLVFQMQEETPSGKFSLEVLAALEAGEQSL